VITNGGEGASVWTAAGVELTRPALAVEVVDTVGAGDAFTSGFIDGLLRAGVDHPAALDAVLGDAALIGRLIERAAAVSGLTCSRAGANPPTADEVDAIIR